MNQNTPNHYDIRHQLFAAAEKGSLQEVKDMLGQAPEAVRWYHKHYMDHTLLHVAAVNGHGKICSLLLKHGADPQALAFANETALDAAIRKENTAAVRAILAQHPTPLEHPEKCQPPLWVALHFGNRKIFDMLVEAGANVMGPCLGGDRSVYESLDTEEFPERKSWIDHAAKRHAELLAEKLSQSTPETSLRSRPRQL